MSDHEEVLIIYLMRLQFLALVISFSLYSRYHALGFNFNHICVCYINSGVEILECVDVCLRVNSTLRILNMASSDISRAEIIPALLLNDTIEIFSGHANVNADEFGPHAERRRRRVEYLASTEYLDLQAHLASLRPELGAQIFFLTFFFKRLIGRHVDGVWGGDLLCNNFKFVITFSCFYRQRFIGANRGLSLPSTPT
jgi:hypothetical protein